MYHQMMWFWTRLELFFHPIKCKSCGADVQLDVRIEGQNVDVDPWGQWLVENNIMVLRNGSTYGLVDEFFRIRLLLDQLDQDVDMQQVEFDLLRQFAAHSSFADETRFQDDITISEDYPGS